MPAPSFMMHPEFFRPVEKSPPKSCWRCNKFLGEDWEDDGLGLCDPCKALLRDPGFTATAPTTRPTAHESAT